MRVLLLFGLILFSAYAYSQPSNVEIKEVDGKKFYVHQVVNGNTLWGLQQTYKVAADDIVKANPVVTDGLKEGQTILIPVNSEQVVKEVKLKNYKVKSRETLYAISREFETTIDNLIALNPELEAGLKKGQIIKVPDNGSNTEEPSVEITSHNPFIVDTVLINTETETKSLTFSDTTVVHTVLDHETLYTIARRFMVSLEELMAINNMTSTIINPGQELIIPVKNEAFTNVVIKEVPSDLSDSVTKLPVYAEKDVYNIALVMPFFVEHGRGYSQYVSDLATQYYMGTMMAVDSLEKLGLNAKLYVYDTRNDSAHVVKILKGEEFSTMDLIIGPLYGVTVPVVAKYCKANKIRMVCPFAIDNSILKGNPYVHASVTSDYTLFNGLGKFCAKTDLVDRIVMIKPKDKGGKANYESVRKAFMDHQVNGVSPTIVEATYDNFTSYVEKGSKVALVYPTRNKSSAIRFMSKVNIKGVKSKADEIVVFGTKDWVGIEDLNNVYKNKYNFHYPSPNFLDYYDTSAVHLNLEYRKRFKTDMTKTAFQGFDVFMHFVPKFFMKNSDFELIMNDIELRQSNVGGGFENGNTFIVEQENFELIRIEKIESK